MPVGRVNRSTVTGLVVIVCTGAFLVIAAGRPRVAAARDDAPAAQSAGTKPADADARPTTNPQGAAPDETLERLTNTRVQLKLDAVPLTKAIEFIGEQADVNTFIDHVALASAGIARDTPVTLKLRHPVAGSQALSLVLRAVSPGLTYKIDNGVVIVSTTPDAQNAARTTASSELETRVYDVTDLIQSDVSGDAIVNLVTNSVTPDAWKSGSGSEQAHASVLGTRLVVAAPSATQTAVTDLLSKVRHPTAPSDSGQVTEKAEPK